MNKENMEKWIEALENYQGEPARHAFVETNGTLCAVGIGMKAAGINLNEFRAIGWIKEFYNWLDMAPVRAQPGTLPAYDTALKPDGSGCDYVARANDMAKQTPWTIAQRLRETYLKEES